MNFNKTTEYALRILGLMSMDENKLYTANEVFEKTGIPFRYLRKQLNELVVEGFLKSIQGKMGGYKISKPLNEINLFEVVKHSENFNMDNQCFFGFNSCPKEERCVMHDKWGQIRDLTLEMLRMTTLQDLKENPEKIYLINQVNQ